MGVRGSKPGERRGGRQKGTPNKIQRDLREKVLAALEQVGGESYLVECATDEDPRMRSSFLGLVGRCLPKEVKLEAKGPMVVIRDFARPSESD